jgi:opacity protein-like surface antigen
MRKVLLVTTLAAAAGTGTAQAAESGLYVGAGVVKAKVDNIFDSRASLNIDNTAWKAILGFKFPLIPLGVEANYVDLGSESRSFGVASAHADAKAFAAYAVGYLPLPLPIIDVYGKAGVARWQLNGRTSGPALFSADDNGTEFAYGGGVQAHFSKLAARLEYERFDIKNTDGAKLWTLGVTWTFL